MSSVRRDRLIVVVVGIHANASIGSLLSSEGRLTSLFGPMTKGFLGTHGGVVLPVLVEDGKCEQSVCQTLAWFFAG